MIKSATPAAAGADDALNGAVAPSPGASTSTGTGTSTSTSTSAGRSASTSTDERDPALVALGGGLVLLALLGWATGLVELATRSGLAAPLRIAVVDVAHLESGVAALALLAASLTRRRPRARRSAAERWCDVALVVTFGSLAVTGTLALLPFSTVARDELVDGHLVAAVLSAPFTIGKLVLSRPRWLPAPGAAPRRVGSGRLLLGAAILLCVPVATALVAPRAVTPLAEAGAGGSWAPDGPALYLDRLVLVSEPGEQQPLLVAGGSGLYVGRLPVAGTTAGNASPPTISWRPALGVPHSDLVLGLAVAPADGGTDGGDEVDPGGSGRIYVGTLNGLEVASNPFGPYRRLPVHAGGVHAIAINPADPRVIWVTSYAGPEMSRDGGRSFVVERAGMRSPETSWALTFLGGPHGAPPVLLASDGYAVYRWDGSRWLVQTPQYSVVSLDPVGDGTVFSSSMGDGIDVGSLAGAGGTLRWRPADGGLEDRRTGGARGIHVVSVTDDGGPTEYAGTMLDGVFVSLDGGKSWSGVWTGLASHGVVSRVVSVDGMLVAATDGGILAYEMPPVQPASPSWWALVILVGLISGAAGAAVLLRRRSDSLPTALLRRRSH